jgi:hypothetical protein
MIELIAVIALIVFVAYREWVHARQTDKLMDRLMAKSLSEYAGVTNGVKPKETESMSDRAEYERYCKKHSLTPEKEES